jgi:hypothetical protein
MPNQSLLTQTESLTLVFGVTAEHTLLRRRVISSEPSSTKKNDSGRNCSSLSHKSDFLAAEPFLKTQHCDGCRWKHTGISHYQSLIVFINLSLLRIWNKEASYYLWMFYICCESHPWPDGPDLQGSLQWSSPAPRRKGEAAESWIRLNA